MNAARTPDEWRILGRHVAVWTLGAALGIGVAVLVLALAGAVVRIPGVQPFLNRILSPDYDAPLMWVLLVSAWMLGVIVAYAVVTLVLKSRDAGPRS